MDLKIKNTGKIKTLDQKSKETYFSVDSTVILWLLFIGPNDIAKHYFVSALLYITFSFCFL